MKPRISSIVVIAGVVAGVTAGGAGLVHAQNAESAPNVPGPVPLGMGAPFGPVVDRPALPFRACATNAPVCIHFDASFDSKLGVAHVARAVASSARAWQSIVEELAFPAPLFDGDRGGDPRFDVYLFAGEPVGETLVVGRDPLDLTIDRDGAPAFLVIDPAVVVEPSCRLDALLARGVARASAMGLDVAETPVVVDGFSRYASTIVAWCDLEERPIFSVFQASPWESLLASPAGPELLARTVDVHDGNRFGAFVPAILSMSIQSRGVVLPVADDFELGPAHFRNDPSVFDVLETTLHDQGRTPDDLLLDLAVARFLDHDDAPPKMEWELAVSTLPRRVAVPRGIEATGMTYDRVIVDRAPKSDTLELDLKWDQGARFRWAVIKLDAEERNVGQVGVARLDRAREMTVEVRGLQGVASVLVVGVNSGDPARPWHPDDPPTSPHGYELGVYEAD
jgi:hypothetical protein